MFVGIKLSGTTQQLIAAADSITAYIVRMCLQNLAQQDARLQWVQAGVLRQYVGIDKALGNANGHNGLTALDRACEPRRMGIKCFFPLGKFKNQQDSYLKIGRHLAVQFFAIS